MSVITKVLGRIQLRGADTSETLSKNETLLDRELYIEKGVGVKIGDGIKQYNNLPYLAKFDDGDSPLIEESDPIWNSEKNEYVKKTEIQNYIPSGLGGTNYVFVKGDGSPAQNHAELRAAYETAKGMSPGVNNVITVVISPGIYEHTEYGLNFNTSYIDITSLTGQPDVIIPFALTFPTSKVTGIKSTVANSFKSTGNTTYVNCIGGDSSFRDIAPNVAIECHNCVGGSNSFSISTGFAYNCHGGSGSLLTSDNSVFSTINRIPVQ